MFVVQPRGGNLYEQVRRRKTPEVEGITKVRKNCEPLVFGPALAELSYNRLEVRLRRLVELSSVAKNAHRVGPVVPELGTEFVLKLPSPDTFPA